MTKPVRNFPESVRARLLAVTNLRKGDFQLTLQRYAAERFLYRLGVSPHREQFVLKGAMLFVLWGDVYILGSRYSFEGPTLAMAISATFTRRVSATFSPWPVALTTSFYTDAQRNNQWGRFLSRSKLSDVPTDFATAGERIIAFLGAPARAVADSVAFSASWPAGGPWQ